MKYILLFISFSVSAEECLIQWNPPTERMDGTPLALEEIQHYRIEAKINGIWRDRGEGFVGDNLIYTSNIGCFDCQSIRVRTVDFPQGLVSDWAYPTCPPAQPVICQ